MNGRTDADAVAAETTDEERDLEAALVAFAKSVGVDVGGGAGDGDGGRRAGMERGHGGSANAKDGSGSGDVRGDKGAASRDNGNGETAAGEGQPHNQPRSKDEYRESLARAKAYFTRSVKGIKMPKFDGKARERGGRGGRDGKGAAALRGGDGNGSGEGHAPTLSPSSPTSPPFPLTRSFTSPHRRRHSDTYTLAGSTRSSLSPLPASPLTFDFGLLAAATLSRLLSVANGDGGDTSEGYESYTEDEVSDVEAGAGAGVDWMSGLESAERAGVDGVEARGELPSHPPTAVHAKADTDSHTSYDAYDAYVRPHTYAVDLGSLLPAPASSSSGPASVPAVNDSTAKSAQPAPAPGTSIPHTPQQSKSRPISLRMPNPLRRRASSARSPSRDQGSGPAQPSTTPGPDEAVQAHPGATRTPRRSRTNHDADAEGEPGRVRKRAVTLRRVRDMLAAAAREIVEREREREREHAQMRREAGSSGTQPVAVTTSGQELDDSILPLPPIRRSGSLPASLHRSRSRSRSHSPHKDPLDAVVAAVVALAKKGRREGKEQDRGAGSKGKKKERRKVGEKGEGQVKDGVGVRRGRKKEKEKDGKVAQVDADGRGGDDLALDVPFCTTDTTLSGTSAPPTALSPPPKHKSTSTSRRRRPRADTAHSPSAHSSAAFDEEMDWSAILDPAARAPLSTAAATKSALALPLHLPHLPQLPHGTIPLLLRPASGRHAGSSDQRGAHPPRRAASVDSVLRPTSSLRRHSPSPTPHARGDLTVPGAAAVKEAILGAGLIVAGLYGSAYGVYRRKRREWVEREGGRRESRRRGQREGRVGVDGEGEVEWAEV
ncbi:hypothetical protein M427DRAFT_68567 [Gonapodya prolifera JEL478]|uniref:Uncharacterized protein n=1 Tax=Gonapodya prolifera (strain JEL478) TaxID=1344416 RepID=A0A139AK30_GONPJ|nr:hypothetical protein M427DRAFT_68567 [Gonapodya prolifera JEL478]|eukprot:KXS17136.1 hypothetical protein M427DRAFT_68567 [Gonapodya prolifera JEL478]